MVGEGDPVHQGWLAFNLKKEIFQKEMIGKISLSQ